jgi:hypothetical protein
VAAKVTNQSRTTSDTSHTTDSTSRSIIFTHTTSDISHATDSAIRSTLAFIRSITDGSISNDNAAIFSRRFTRTTFDSSTLSDSLIGILHRSIGSEDSSLTTDEGAFTFNINSIVTDHSVSVDSAQYLIYSSYPQSTLYQISETITKTIWADLAWTTIVINKNKWEYVQETGPFIIIDKNNTGITLTTKTYSNSG